MFSFMQKKERVRNRERDRDKERERERQRGGGEGVISDLWRSQSLGTSLSMDAILHILLQGNTEE